MKLLDNKNIKGILYAALAFFMFTCADAFIKDLSSTYHGAQAGLMSVTFSLFFIFLFQKRLGGFSFCALRHSTKHKWHMIRSVIGTIGFLCFIIGIGQIDLATTYAIILTAPFWSVLMAIPLFGEKIGWHRSVAIIIGFLGVLIVLRPGFETISPAAFLMMGCSISGAVFFVLSRKIGEDEPMTNSMIYIYMSDIILIGLFCLFWVDIKMPELQHLPYFMASGAFYLAGTLSIQKGFGMAETSAVAPLHYTQLIWGPLIGYFIFQEIPNIWTVIGGGIIVASGLTLIYREHVTHKKTQIKEEGKST